MRAVGYRSAGPLDRPDALVDVDLPDPAPGPEDLLVAVAAVGANPVDTKIRKRREPTGIGVLGWDAVGTVVGVGAAVAGFAAGDRVYYAGEVNRPGCNSELHAVDHRLVGHAPKSLDDPSAAALPLTTITAWELLFDRLGVSSVDRGVLLVVGAAGGVGSMLVQLARQLTGLTIVGTAGRPESAQWLRDLGAHQVIDHREPWSPQLLERGIEDVGLVASLTATGEHWPAILEVVAPQGRVALIDDPDPPLDVNAMKPKSLSLHWEFMFARSTYRTPDMAEQGRILSAAASLVDDGRLRSTLTRTMGPICAETLLEAHRVMEAGTARGKIVIAGW